MSVGIPLTSCTSAWRFRKTKICVFLRGCWSGRMLCLHLRCDHAYIITYIHTLIDTGRGGEGRGRGTIDDDRRRGRVRGHAWHRLGVFFCEKKNLEAGLR